MDYLLYIVIAMTFWDFTIHIIDKRDRKYQLSGELDKKWSEKMKKSKSIFSYYYPFFWGREDEISEAKAAKGQKRYDLFWITYWGIATVLLVIYAIYK